MWHLVIFPMLKRQRDEAERLRQIREQQRKDDEKNKKGAR